MEQNDNINIDVVYITPEQQNIIKLELLPGSTIEKAVQKSSLLTTYPEIDLNVNKVGIFSKIQSLDTVLSDGDRVEIYRPLHADPKEARRRRANKK